MSYYRPNSLDDALAIRADRDVTLLAGGTDVFPARASDRGWGRMSQKPVLDLTAIDALRGIEEGETHTRIGALATWSELVKAPLPPVFDALKAAAREVGGLQIQNRGTLVGNICNASPAADGVPVLLCLDAEVVLLCLDAEVVLAGTSGDRIVPLAEFITGNRETTCRSDEIVTELRLPNLAPAARSNFSKLGSRRYLVISIVMAAGIVLIEEGIVRELRLSIGACAPVAFRLRALEATLIGRAVRDLSDHDIALSDLESLAPIDDIRASAEYRRSAARTLLQRLLQDLLQSDARRAA